jgi:type I restriction enzyme S subunit
MPELATKRTTSGWTTVAFGDVVRQIKDKVDPEESGLDRYVAGEHMGTDDLRIRHWGELGDGYLGPAFHMRFKPGQVLYGSRRTYLRKVAVAEFEGITANTTYVLESADPEVLLPELLPFVMQTEAFAQHSVRESKGSVNPYVNFSDLARFEFALPPIEEQGRLVGMLGAARMVVESSSKLVDQLRLLLRSATDATAIKGVRSESVASLADLVADDRPICYGILMPGNGYENGVPVVKVKNYPDGSIDVEGLLLTDPKIDEEYQRSRLSPGDLIISIRGTIGRVASVPDCLSGANITQDTARLSVRPEANTDYVRAMLESSFVQRQIAAYTTGLAVKGINIGELRRIEIPMVNESKQAGLVSEVMEIRPAIAAANRRRADAVALMKRALSSALGGGG